MTGDCSQLTNFVHKCLGIVKFGNDQIAKIMGYGNYQIRNITISRVYYVEGLGHNQFSVGQFFNSDLEVAFRKHMCFVRNLEGVDLLSRSQETNLYTLLIEDMMASSPICLLFKASKTKSWLRHRRLSHLNFGTINHSAKNGFVRDTNQENLYLLHMDLCGHIRVASINGKKYILIIVDDYSRFTWVKFLASKDEAPDFIIEFLKMIQVRLNTLVRNIYTNNGTEVVNHTIRSYYESVVISHETLVARSPQQNCVIKRRNHTLVEAARTMLIYAKAPLFVWDEAVATAFPVANAPRAVDLADSPVSTSIDQDAPSTSAVDLTLFTQKAGNDLLLGTINMGLWYLKDTGMSLTAYADADHAGCQDTRRSTSGSAQFLGDKLVSWSSKKLKSTAILSTEAKYIALSSTIALCYNNVQHSRAKHIDVRYHFIKKQVKNGIVKLYFVWTEYQLADIFTKPLPRERFNFLIEKLGMRSMSPETLTRLTEEEDE
nr:putative ribonuclease H-like domain-containing protein [Tanacetum cinerariifolium]